MAKERRKVRVGEVVSDKMDKTVVVAVRWRQRHPLYGKAVPRISKFYAHDGENRCKLGDLVRIEETRPLSRLKHWRVIEVVRHREIAEVKPIELDRELLAETQAEPLPTVEEKPLLADEEETTAEEVAETEPATQEEKSE